MTGILGFTSLVGRSQFRRAGHVASRSFSTVCATARHTPPGPTPPVFYYSDTYAHPLPAGHRFPMHKYGLVRAQLERSPLLSNVRFACAPLVSHEDLALVHDAQYVATFEDGSVTPDVNRRIGFPWSRAGVRRARASTGATVAATRDILLANNMRFAAHLAGGTHHAMPDTGAGFCVFSDIAVAAAVALKEFPDRVRTVLVVDLDVHQGDGNAVIFQNDDRVITFSLHGATQAFPPERQRSNYDVALRDGVEDAEYLEVLRMYIPGLFERHAPDLVFYQAGVDCLAEDSLGRMSLTRSGLSLRNMIVYQACVERQLPFVVTMGGGYARPDIGPSVDAHADVYLDAMRAVHNSKSWVHSRFSSYGNVSSR